jgi:hypothetical protein
MHVKIFYLSLHHRHLYVEIAAKSLGPHLPAEPRLHQKSALSPLGRGEGEGAAQTLIAKLLQYPLRVHCIAKTERNTGHFRETSAKKHSTTSMEHIKEEVSQLKLI